MGSGRKRVDAQRRNILMYCAAADQGNYGSDQDLMPKKALPDYIRAIGSAKEGGHQSKFVDFNQVDYLFPGEDIEELQIGRRRGSSAATALATGLAALILWCFATQDHAGGTAKKSIGPTRMDNIFHSLVAYEKWIDVTKLLGRDGSATIDGVVKRCEKVMDLRVT